MKRIKIAWRAVALCLLGACLSGCVSNQNEKTSTMKRRIINPWTWQDKFGFVQSNEVTDSKRTLYTSGIVSVDNEGNLLYPGDMKKQIDQIMDNMEVLLKEADFELTDVVKFTYYTTDIQAFSIAAPQTLNERLKQVDCNPATSLIGVASLFHPDCVVEIEAILVD